MDALFSPLFESNLWREPFGRSIFCTESDDRAMRNLFANGEQGGYWPADPAYAYEDSAGTMAASVNGVVGLRYDVSKGLALGPNLWIPESVYLAAGWTRNGDIFTCDGTSGNIYIVGVLTTGRFYRFTVDLVGVVNLFLGSSSPVHNVTGDNYFWQAINAGSPNVTIQNGTTGIKTATNVSVNEVYGNHAIQTTTGNKPYLRLTPTTNKYWYDSNTATGALTATFSGALGSACTVATVTPEGVTILENQTVGTTYNICPPYGYNSDVLIIDRALTPAEKALVTRVMVRDVPGLVNELQVIQSIFVHGGFGGWYSRADFSKLLTTYNGTTAVTAINDAIGRNEPFAGTIAALNATSTQRPLLKQLATGQYHPYHDRVDDKLTLASMPAGDYTIAFASFAGASIYSMKLNTTGTLSLPAIDATEMLVINRALTDAETSSVRSILTTKAPTIGATDILRLYSATNSVSLAITETGGDSGTTWELGDGQTASGTSCVKTITAPQSVILRATTPNKITTIDWSAKSLFGQIVDLSKLTALSTFYCHTNQLTGSIPSLTTNTALSTFYCHTNQLTGSIPSLTTNTALIDFHCGSNQLTGSITSLTTNTALISFGCGSNQLTGFIPSLTTNTALIAFDCGSNQLTGSIPSLTTNTALIYFNCGSNQLTGFIPSLTTNTALIYFNCGSNQLTGSIPSLSTNTALTNFYCDYNQLTGSIPSLTTNTALAYFYCYSNQLTGSIPSLTTNTALVNFYCYGNQLTDFAGGTVSGTLDDFRAQNNLLTETAVNAILAAFVAANRTTGTRVLNLGGTGNAAPTGQGITDKATLQSRGWTVTTN